MKRSFEPPEACPQSSTAVGCGWPLRRSSSCIKWAKVYPTNDTDDNKSDNNSVTSLKHDTAPSDEDHEALIV
eukprot:scaffold258159_cov41-Prasinocladus_malaysianus.AAC.1